MLYVAGLCASCQVGTLGVRRCADGATLVLMCDEDDAVWLDPADVSIEAVHYPSSGTFAIDGTALAIGGGGAAWATREEVERAGWTKYIIGESPDRGAKRKKKA